MKDYTGQAIPLFKGIVEDVYLNDSMECVARIRMPNGSTQVHSVEQCQIEAIRRKIWELKGQ